MNNRCNKPRGSAGFTLVETAVALAVGVLVFAAMGSLSAVALTRGVSLTRRVDGIVQLQQLTREIQQLAAEQQPPFWQSPQYFAEQLAAPAFPDQESATVEFARDHTNSIYGWKISIEYEWNDEPITLLAPFGSRPLEQQ